MQHFLFVHRPKTFVVRLEGPPQHGVQHPLDVDPYEAHRALGVFDARKAEQIRDQRPQPLHRVGHAGRA